jgi:hypothetical protein
MNKTGSIGYGYGQPKTPVTQKKPHVQDSGSTGGVDFIGKLKNSLLRISLYNSYKKDGIDSSKLQNNKKDTKKVSAGNDVHPEEARMVTSRSCIGFKVTQQKESQHLVSNGSKDFPLVKVEPPQRQATGKSPLISKQNSRQSSGLRKASLKNKIQASLDGRGVLGHSGTGGEASKQLTSTPKPESDRHTRTNGSRDVLGKSRVSDGRSLQLQPVEPIYRPVSSPLGMPNPHIERRLGFHQLSPCSPHPCQPQQCFQQFPQYSLPYCWDCQRFGMQSSHHWHQPYGTGRYENLPADSGTVYSPPNLPYYNATQVPQISMNHQLKSKTMSRHQSPQNKGSLLDSGFAVGSPPGGRVQLNDRSLHDQSLFLPDKAKPPLNRQPISTVISRLTAAAKPAAAGGAKTPKKIAMVQQNTPSQQHLVGGTGDSLTMNKPNGQ